MPFTIQNNKTSIKSTLAQVKYLVFKNATILFLFGITLISPIFIIPTSKKRKKNDAWVSSAYQLSKKTSFPLRTSKSNLKSLDSFDKKKTFFKVGSANVKIIKQPVLSNHEKLLKLLMTIICARPSLAFYAGVTKL